MLETTLSLDSSMKFSKEFFRLPHLHQVPKKPWLKLDTAINRVAPLKCQADGKDSAKDSKGKPSQLPNKLKAPKMATLKLEKTGLRTKADIMNRPAPKSGTNKSTGTTYHARAP